MRLLLTFFALVTIAYSTTLTGTLKNPDGTTASGTLYLSLAQQAALSSGCGGPAEIVPSIQVKIVVTSGSMVGSPTVYGNDCLLPQGTYYNVSFNDLNGNLIFTDRWLITGGSIDIGTIVSVVIAGTTQTLGGGAVLTLPAGVQTVTQPAGDPLTVNLLTVTDTVNLPSGFQCTSGGCVVGSGMIFNGGIVTGSSSNSAITIGSGGNFYLRTIGGNASCGGIPDGWIAVSSTLPGLEVCVGGVTKNIPFGGSGGGGGGGGGGGTGGTITTVGFSAPSWLAVFGSPLTGTGGTIALTGASGQFSHRVIGTCGASTVVGLCSLAPADIPNLAESQISNLVSDLSGKQAVGNYITSLTGDMTGTGPGSTATNLSVTGVIAGSYGNATNVPQILVDAKGRVLSISNVGISGGGAGTINSITLTTPAWYQVTGSPVTSGAGVLQITPAVGQTSHRVIGTCGVATSVSLCQVVAGDLPSLPESQITNLISDLATKQSTGNYITALSGDMTAAGPGVAAASLNPSGVTAGTYGDSSHVAQINVDAKGRIIGAVNTSIVGGGGGGGVPPYLTTVTSSGSSTLATITASTHGQGPSAFLVARDNSGNYVFPGYQVDGSGNISFPRIWVAGTYKLYIFGSTGGSGNSNLQTGHIITTGTTPIVSSCGASTTGTLNHGNDHYGQIDLGTGTMTTCTLTFALSWNAPVCGCWTNSTSTTCTPTTLSTSAMTMTITPSYPSGKVYYHCGDTQ